MLDIPIEWEHKIRVNTDCPDAEVVARDVTYPLVSGGTMICNHLRVVTGPPYRNATFLECRIPYYAEPPSERTRSTQ